MDGGGIGKGKGCKRDGLVEGLEFETIFLVSAFHPPRRRPPHPTGRHRQSWLEDRFPSVLQYGPLVVVVVVMLCALRLFLLVSEVVGF